MQVSTLKPIQGRTSAPAPSLYRIDWTFAPNSKGGDWHSGEWTPHTIDALRGMNLGQARKALRELRAIFTPEVRDCFRLVKIANGRSLKA